MVFRIIVCAEIGSAFSNSDGNRYVPYLNWNDDKRQLNANDFDNNWDSDNRFLVFRTSLCEKIALSCISNSPYARAVFNLASSSILERTALRYNFAFRAK